MKMRFPNKVYLNFVEEECMVPVLKDIGYA